MYPDLLKLGNFTLHTYGFCIALGALLGIAFVSHRARKVGLDQQLVLDLVFYLLIAAIIGSRIFYILLNPGYYLRHPLEIFMIWRGGLVFYGGFLLAFPTCFFYLKKRGLPFLKTCDILAPGIAWGKLWEEWAAFCRLLLRHANRPSWAVTFTHPNSLAKLGVPLHPTQLYASAQSLLVLIILAGLGRFKRADGQILWLYIFLYALGRLITENFRGDERGLLVGGYITLTQAIAVLFIPLALGMMLHLARRNPHSGQLQNH